MGRDASICYHRFNPQYAASLVAPAYNNPYLYTRSGFVRVVTLVPQNAMVQSKPSLMPAFYPMPSQTFVAQASAAPIQQLPNWLTETGATYHMSGNPPNPTTSIPLTGTHVPREWTRFAYSLYQF